ncbi:hypothetical protein [Tenacibaculum halocynthiae]|uniref:hypothetical protein n=1 Tax=Tenacibaculum halocynthiae TaxID=1254437 RepID=UPI003895052E
MKQDKTTIKTYFETGDKPTQEQFADLIDSYVDSKQGEGEANRRFIIDAAGEVNLTSEQKIPEYTLSEITGNKLALLKDGATVKEIDLTPYIDDTNLARLISGKVDTNGIATFTRDDNSTFTLDLSNLKGGLNLQQITDNGKTTTNSIEIQEKNGLIVNQGGNSNYQSVYNSLSSSHKRNNLTGVFNEKSIYFFNPGGFGNYIALTYDHNQVMSSGQKQLIMPYKTGILATTEDIPKIQAGTNVTIDKTDPLQPIINSISSIEGITSIGTIANNDNEIIIGNKPLGAYASFSYNGGNNLFGENNMVGGVNISTLDNQNNPVVQGKVLHIGGAEPAILNLSSTANVQSFAKGGNTLKDYLFDFNFTEGFKIKKRIAGVVGNTNQAVIKATNLTTNINVEIPNKSGTLAITEDIPQIQAGTNVTIDTTNPLQPIINATGQDGSVTLDTTQTISGQKTFDALLQTKSIQTNGGLSTSGNITAGGRIRAAKNALDFTEENNAGSATIKANIVGSSLHTLQPKSGTIAHLDDIVPVLPTNFYEKGNWPINMLVQGVSITPGNSLTFFERQGNKVNCVVDLRLFDTNEQTNTNNGTFQFDLPFPCINNSAIGNVIEFNSGDGANAVQYTGNLTPDVVNNKLFLVKSLKREYLRPGDAVFHDTSGADSTRIIISFSYLTTVYTP